MGILGEVLQDILYRYFAQLNISLYKQMFSDFFHQEIYDTEAGSLDIQVVDNAIKIPPLRRTG